MLLARSVERGERLARGAAVAAACFAALVWVDGVVFEDRLVDRVLATGDVTRTLAPGPLLPFVAVGALSAWVLAVWLVLPGASLEQRDMRQLVTIGGGLLVPAGANDSLLDAGLITSVPLVDLACLLTLIVIGVVLSRRTRVAFGDTRARIEEQTRELSRRHALLAERERREALGTLCSGLGHEINNPLTVVTINLDRLEELLVEVDASGRAIDLVRAALADAGVINDAVVSVGEPDGADTGEEAEPPSSETRGTLRVLVIDDEPAVARALARLLRRCEVTIAGDAEEALALARSRSFERVLCDVMMPRKNGVDVYRSLRNEGLLDGTVFAFMTGGAFSTELARLVRETGVPVIHKPIDQASLESVIGPLAQDCTRSVQA
jgi:CheY-like chemotaxis protein